MEHRGGTAPISVDSRAMRMLRVSGAQNSSDNAIGVSGERATTANGSFSTGTEPQFGNFESPSGQLNNIDVDELTSRDPFMGRGLLFDPFKSGGGLRGEGDGRSLPSRFHGGAASPDSSLGDYGWGNGSVGNFNERSDDCSYDHFLFDDYGDNRFANEPSSPPPLSEPAWPNSSNGSNVSSSSRRVSSSNNNSRAKLSQGFSGLQLSVPPGMDSQPSAPASPSLSSRAEPKALSREDGTTRRKGEGTGRLSKGGSGRSSKREKQASSRQASTSMLPQSPSSPSLSAAGAAASAAGMADPKKSGRSNYDHKRGDSRSSLGRGSDGGGSSDAGNDVLAAEQRQRRRDERRALRKAQQQAQMQSEQQQTALESPSQQQPLHRPSSSSRSGHVQQLLRLQRQEADAHSQSDSEDDKDRSNKGDSVPPVVPALWPAGTAPTAIFGSSAQPSSPVGASFGDNKSSTSKSNNYSNNNGANGDRNLGAVPASTRASERRTKAQAENTTGRQEQRHKRRAEQPSPPVSQSQLSPTEALDSESSPPVPAVPACATSSSSSQRKPMQRALSAPRIRRSGSGAKSLLASPSNEPSSVDKSSNPTSSGSNHHRNNSSGGLSDERTHLRVIRPQLEPPSDNSHSKGNGGTNEAWDGGSAAAAAAGSSTTLSSPDGSLNRQLQKSPPRRGLPARSASAHVLTGNGHSSSNSSSSTFSKNWVGASGSSSFLRPALDSSNGSGPVERPPSRQISPFPKYLNELGDSGNPLAASRLSPVAPSNNAQEVAGAGVDSTAANKASSSKGGPELKRSVSGRLLPVVPDESDGISSDDEGVVHVSSESSSGSGSNGSGSSGSGGRSSSPATSVHLLKELQETPPSVERPVARHRPPNESLFLELQPGAKPEHVLHATAPEGGAPTALAREKRSNPVDSILHEGNQSIGSGGEITSQSCISDNSNNSGTQQQQLQRVSLNRPPSGSGGRSAGGGGGGHNSGSSSSGGGGGTTLQRRHSNHSMFKAVTPHASSSSERPTDEWGFPSSPAQLLTAKGSGDGDGDDDEDSDFDGAGSHRRVYLLAGDPFATIVTHSKRDSNNAAGAAAAGASARTSPVLSPTAFVDASNKGGTISPRAAILSPLTTPGAASSSDAHTSPPSFLLDSSSSTGSMSSPRPNQGGEGGGGKFGRPVSAKVAPRPVSARRPPGGTPTMTNSGIGGQSMLGSSGIGTNGNGSSNGSTSSRLVSPASPRATATSPRTSRSSVSPASLISSARPVSARGGAKRPASPPMLSGSEIVMPEYGNTNSATAPSSMEFDRQHSHRPAESSRRSLDRSLSLDSIGDDEEEEEVDDNSAYLETSLDCEFLGLFSN